MLSSPIAGSPAAAAADAIGTSEARVSVRQPDEDTGARAEFLRQITIARHAALTNPAAAAALLMQWMSADE